MTILIGVLCKDGVVIGADSSATFAAGELRTIEQPIRKIDIIDGKIIVAGTGQVGLGQRFSYQIKKHGMKKNLRDIKLKLQEQCAKLGLAILPLLMWIKVNTGHW